MKEGNINGRYSNIRVDYNLRVFSDNGNLILDDYIWTILRSINELGSLKAVADKCGVSYRKLWGDLKTTEGELGINLINKIRGGEHGGRSTLTHEGEVLLEELNKLHSNISESINDYIISFKRTLKKK